MEYESDSEGYVNFGDVSRGGLGIQCQYGSRYVTGVFEDYPNLGEGLRFKNLSCNHWHGIRIHHEDVPALLKRYSEYRAERLQS
jgi:hypothetical protein